MMTTISNYFILIVLLASACAPLPGIVDVIPTSTSIPTQTAEPLPTLTPTPVVWPTDFSPVLYGGKQYGSTFFLLLGGVSGDVWYAPDLSVARYAGEATYSLHSLNQKDKYFLWGKSPELSPTCGNYFIGIDASLDEAGFVGTFDGWEVTKRDVVELSSDGSVYQQAVIDWLKSEGLRDPQIGDLHVYKVDIEGDSVDEVFLGAAHLDGSQHMTREGDYSIVLMRKVVGNEVLTFNIVGDIYRSQEPEITFPLEYSIANFIDLNRDGVLEVVVDIQKWEGFGAIVYQIDDQDVIQTLRAEC